jgi:alpha-glutamyl/putrescinyl thymine pyrophosphorylase clade 1
MEKSPWKGMEPTPRQEPFDAYWRFAAERQAIFFRRLRHEAPPWTDDPILRDYKFCNAYRASDRVSQFLIRDVIYQSGFDCEDTFLRIVLFRLFSKIETWKLLEANHGPITARSFDAGMFGETLDRKLGCGEAIYTNAFILTAHNAFGHLRKHRNHLALVEAMLRDELPARIACAKSLEEVYQQLRAYPMIGLFMAYQLAIDLNYSEIVAFDENDFVAPGLGAQRGIAKCFTSTGSLSDSELIKWMVERQEDEFKRLGLRFQSLWGRPLHAIDYQNLFCEIDKYARIAFPDLKSDRIRIKTKFRPTDSPIDYFYPPKWGINDTISSATLHRSGAKQTAVLPSLSESSI